MTDESSKGRTALHCALDLLARREHFKSELITKLRLRKFEEPEIRAAISEAIAQGWQSEDRACESYVRSRMQKGFGPLKILSELQSRQVNGSLIEKWLPSDKQIWCQVLAGYCKKRFKTMEGEAINPKQLRSLVNRGFSVQLINLLYALDYSI